MGVYGLQAPAWAKAGPGQALLLAFGLAYDFARPEPPQARPKPGLSGQARASTSLVRNPEVPSTCRRAACITITKMIKNHSKNYYYYYLFIL